MLQLGDIALFSSFVLEKSLHQLPTVLGKHAAGDTRLGMQGTGCVFMVATFRVITAIDDARHLCPSQGTGTHGAWLHGDVECAVRQVLATQRVGSGGNGRHLRMGSDIAKSLCQVMGTRHHPLFAHHDTADGYLPFVGSPTRLV